MNSTFEERWEARLKKKPKPRCALTKAGVPWKKTHNWHPIHTPYSMSLMQLCYFAALIEGLRLIDETARDKGVRKVKISAPALVDFVQRKGVVIYRLQGGA